MKGSNAIAIAAVVLVIAAIGGVYLLTQANRPRPLTAEQQIGAGIGNLVGGIVGLATSSGGDGGGGSS